jgi:two-component system, cell cycle sensor histidine kinase and response regulator CckA
MGRPLRTLILEDSEADAELVARELTRSGFDLSFERVDTRDGLVEALARPPWDLIIADYMMPTFQAPAALAIIRERQLDVPVIIVSGTIGEETAVDSLRAGARDFLVKGRLARLVPAVERELREKAERDAKRRAEERARRFEDRYRLLFASCPLPMFVYDGETLAFLAVNDAAVRHYGYSRDAFAKMTIADIRAADDTDVPRDDASPRKAGEGLLRRHKKQDGTVITVEIKTCSFEFEDRPAWLVLANDVTDRERLEEQVRRSQKMDAIGYLAGGVAHDFNNLLSVILTYTALVLDGMPLEDAARNDLKQVRRAAEQAADLTRQLLAFSRQQMLQRRIIDLNQVVGGMEKKLRRLVGEKIDLSLATGRSAGTILADPAQVEQVITNVVLNSRDAMPTGGSVSISTEGVEIDADYATQHIELATGTYVMITVTDTGCGMDGATLARVFEPFFTTKDTGKATGLGMSTVFGVVRQGKGHVAVRSEPGKGTTVKIYFPVVEGRVDAASAA